MKRTNLFKGILCGLMLTAVASSVVFAANKDFGIYGYKNGNMKHSFLGSVGVYSSEGTKTAFNTFAYNSTKNSRLFRIEASCKDIVSGNYPEFYADSGIISKGKKIGAGVYRDYKEKRFEYTAYARGYYGTHETSGVADTYKYTIFQKK